MTPEKWWAEANEKAFAMHDHSARELLTALAQVCQHCQSWGGLRILRHAADHLYVHIWEATRGK